jgi:carboxyl-terminal processing protease
VYPFKKNIVKQNILSLFLIVLLSAAIGYLLGNNNIAQSDPQEQQYESLSRITKLMEYLSQDYVDEINTDSLVGVVITDIMEQLDPHSVYIPANREQEIAESMQGNFVGIGVSFFMLRDSVAVVRVLEGGPAEKAGILPGDRILMADLDTLYQKNHLSEYIVSRLKGSPNTQVKLQVYRKKSDSLLTIDLERGDVPLPSVSSSYMFNDEVGYIKINRFSQTTYEEFSAALDNLLEQRMQHLVLDLRENPGGYLLPAKQIVDEFLERGSPIVIVEGNNGNRQKTIAKGSGRFEQGGLYVLVDEQSASASEVIAGAIQDNDRGYIIGRRTFGKGLVQQQMPLGQGDQVRLTTARYYTPTGRSIQRPYDNETRDEYYAEIQSRFESGEMASEDKMPVNNGLAFTTPKGRTVYGGGGIAPDIFIPNNDTTEDEWNTTLFRSILINRFVFLELDKHPNKHQFDNAAYFYSEPLEFADDFINAFEDYCKENNFPVNFKDKDKILSYIKANIANQIFSENLYNRIINQEDPFIQEALDRIAND